MADASRSGLDAAQPPGCDEAEVDVGLLFSGLAMDVILRTLFGSAAGIDTATTARAVQDISEVGFEEMFWPLTLPDWLPLPGKAVKRRAMRQLKGLLQHQLARPEAAQGNTLLAMLRALRDGDGGGGLAEQEILDQCMVSFTAGHETTRNLIATGTLAAARGGFTTVVCMPNTTPAVDNAGTVALINDKAAKSAHANVYITGAITKGIAGEELAPIGSLKKAGVVAITDDGHCVQNNDLMRRAL